MIGPSEIKKQAERWYSDYLVATVAGQPFFPKEVRFGKVKASETLADYSQIKAGIAELIDGSRKRTGFGYELEFIVRRDRKTGEQRFPQRIWFLGEEDYLRFVGKEKEAGLFRRDVKEITAALPQLREWVLANPLKVIEHAGIWRELCEVCAYFVAHPRPGLYIRELPLELPTKFVETHKGVLRLLLDFLIPEHANREETEFEKRFNLKYDEPLIRLLILDEDLARRCFSGLRDTSIPQSSFHALAPDCKTVLILENKTNFTNIYNFLALPEAKQTLAVFGKGFQLGLLKNAAWLAGKRIVYWGDIDAHGFQMLSQLRSYFPQTRSLMMDRETFEAFRDYQVIGAETSVASLPHLTAEEHALFSQLARLEAHNRLEQEKISHAYASKKIHEMLARG
jgi:hypothetical protein